MRGQLPLSVLDSECICESEASGVTREWLPPIAKSTGTSFEVGNANGLGQSGRLRDGIRLNSQWRCSDWGVWGLAHIQANM